MFAIFPLIYVVLFRLRTIWVFPMRTIPATRNGESYLGPVFSTIYKFVSIQFLDALLSDGYFRIFWTKKNKVIKMCPKYLLTHY